MDDLIFADIDEHLATIHQLRDHVNDIERLGMLVADTLEAGGKILLCGNGGSAGDAQHIAAELVGRFVHDRRSLPAIALTTDTSALTAIANDYGYEHVFARQVEGLAAPGDLLIGISTSGNSPNVIRACEAARSADCRVGILTGGSGGQLKAHADESVVVPSTTTARIQEMHILIGHLLCAMVERALRLN